jgi:hypothetical protein
MITHDSLHQGKRSDVGTGIIIDIKDAFENLNTRLFYSEATSYHRENCSSLNHVATLSRRKHFPSRYPSKRSKNFRHCRKTLSPREILQHQATCMQNELHDHHCTSRSNIPRHLGNARLTHAPHRRPSGGSVFISAPRSLLTVFPVFLACDPHRAKARRWAVVA